jgi:hypothetical protein
MCYFFAKKKTVAKNRNALQCDECDTWPWVHAKCDGITKEEYRRFENIHSLIRSCMLTFFLSLIRLLQFTVTIRILFAVWSELLMVSDEGASPTPVSPVNDESDSDRPYLL